MTGAPGLSAAEREAVWSAAGRSSRGQGQPSECPLYAAVEAILRNRLAVVAADLYRNHNMPPRKDSRSYSYRAGWWDGVHHAAAVVERAAAAAGEGTS